MTFSRLSDRSAIRNVVVVVSPLLREVFHEFYDVIPDDSVLSWEHYVRPHPVNRERNVSQVVILLCLRRGKDVK